MIDIVAAVDSEGVLSANLARSAVLGQANVNFQRQRGFRSAASAYNSAFSKAKSETVVFVHQDVYLPRRWFSQLQSAVQWLNETDPNWAVLGVYGVTDRGKHIGYVWSSGLNRVLGGPFVEPVRVDSLDELLIVLRKRPQLRFDENLPGFHLYGTDIVQEARSLGYGSYAICAPVVHNSRPVVYLSNSYLAAYDYERKKWKCGLPIQNCIAPIANSITDRVRRGVRYRIDSWRYRNIDRSALDRGLDCVEIAKKLGFE